MPRLVVLSEGYTGRTYELKVERTTVGRVEDNAFQIADPSVSSHHCEVLLHGEEILIRDLNSTNGSYINGEKIAESILKQGQILRLGMIELRLEPTPAVGPSGKKIIDKTQVIPQGVKLDDLEKGASKPVTFEKEGAFKKKSNKAGKITLIIGIVLGVVIIVAIVLAFLNFR
jgi:pSer/pThr/pTyr-binding forkhead associated (FHA) protein